MTQAGFPDGGTGSSFATGHSTTGSRGATQGASSATGGPTSGATTSGPTGSSTSGSTSGNSATASSTTSTTGTPTGTSSTGGIGSTTGGVGTTTSTTTSSSGTSGGQPCASGCSVPPASYCQDSNTQISFGAATGCIHELCTYQATATACVFGCVSGSCAPVQACTAGEVRCSGNQVEVCNPTGSAWLFQKNCPSTCANGLCDARCTPDAGRCDGDLAQVCSSSGAAWDNAQTCANACLDGTCLQTDLIVDGVTVVMSGEYHFTNSVVVENGGTIQVGAGGWLSLYAPTIDVQVASSITGVASLSGCAYTPPDNIENGIRLIGSQVTVDGTVSWSDNSACQYDGLLLRADAVGGSGTVTGGPRALILYGAGGPGNTLQAGGAVTSLMPPNQITSAVYPALGSDPSFSTPGTYNDDGPPPSFAWDRPYATVAGYYYVFGQTPAAVPTPTSTLDSTETLALPSQPAAGANFLDVVGFDRQGRVGTVPHEFSFNINSAPPVLASSTNPTQGTYTTNSSSIISWSGGNGQLGYFYVLDDFPVTHPDLAAGTFEPADLSPAQVLLQTLSDGRQWFHLAGQDSMGYLTKAAAHYELDIGTAPQPGAIAGTVLDENSNPIVGATVILQRGLASQTTVAGGVYTFGSTVPAGSYELVANAPGMQSEALTVTVMAGQTTNGDFQLQPGAGCPTCADACSVSNCTHACQEVWNATCDQGVCLEQGGCTYGCNATGTACLSGVDGSPCTQSSQCASGGCQNGSCQGSMGEPCTANEQCVSGYCGSSGTCVVTCLPVWGYCGTTQCCYGEECCPGTSAGTVCALIVNGCPA